MNRFPYADQRTPVRSAQTLERQIPGRRGPAAVGVEAIETADQEIPSGAIRRHRGRPRDESEKKRNDLATIIERKRGAFSASALAELLGCSEKYIYALAKSARIPHLRIGAMIRFDPSQTAEWLRKHLIAA